MADDSVQFALDKDLAHVMSSSTMDAFDADDIEEQ